MSLTMPSASVPVQAMRSITADDQFLFDLTGYLHLRGVLAPGEIADALAWSAAAERVDLAAFHGKGREAKHHLDRPVSRILDVEPRFLHFLDHPTIASYLATFCGPDYRHIDNDLLNTVPGYPGGGWHRGVPAHDTGYCFAGYFDCPMVKVFFCLSDVGPGQGPFEVVPGSHKSQLQSLDDTRPDLPGQHVFDDVTAGDVILFNEAVLHNGRPNTTARTRRTLVINYGNAGVKCWVGYHPLPATLARCTPRQRAILTNDLPGDWESPVVAGQPRLGKPGMM